MSENTQKDTSETLDDLSRKLTDLGLNSELIKKLRTDLGATTLDDLQVLTEADLVGIGMKAVPARKFVQSLAPATPKPVNSSALNPMSLDDVLPAPPTDESWLKALRAGGTLKIGEASVISAVRAALADRAGLYQVPERLVQEMERFADTTEEQVDPVYFSLRRQLTRRSYGEIFEAVEGLDGSYVTESRRKKLLERINNSLWPSIMDFHGALKGWFDNYFGPGNQSMLMSNAILNITGGGSPVGIGITPPETGTLRSQAEDVNSSANRVFAGTGVQIAAALAYEALKISETLQNQQLPAMIGAANREQMLRQLGVAVSSTYPRLEVNLVRYVLCILNVDNVPAGNEETRYFAALHNLGQQIPWDMLTERTLNGVTGIGGGRQNRL